MTEAIQRRKGTTAQHALFTGLEAEVTVDISKDTAVVHDGETQGGIPLAREDLQNSPTFTGATDVTAGAKGIVPAPAAGDEESVLYGDGTWSPVRIRNVAIISALVDPSDEIGDDGQYWINTDTNMMFGPKANGEWPAGFDLVGPKGDTGDTGDKGDKGDTGKTVMYGTNNPAAEDGIDGDFYINTTSWSLFGPKADDEWPSGVSIVGPQGIQGEQGVQGEQGEVGLGMPVGGAHYDFLRKASVSDHDYEWSNDLRGVQLTSYAETVHTESSVSGSYQVNYVNGSIHRLTTAGDISLTPYMIPAGKAVTLTIVVDNPDGYDMTPFPSTKWPGGYDPDFTVLGLSIYCFTTFDGGSTWLGVVSGQGFQ